MRSVRARTALVAGLGIVTAFVVLSLLLLALLRQSLIDEIDRSIDARAADISFRVEDTDEVTSLGLGLSGDTFAAVVVGGEIWASTDNGATATAIDEFFEEFGEPVTLSWPELTGTLGADNLRAVAVEIFSTGEDGERFFDGDLVFVASSLDPVDRTIRRLAALLLFAGPLFALTGAALVWLLTGRALRPVEAIRFEAASITGSELHRRVPDPGSNDEIAKLAETMNMMLDRLEEAQRRQQQFVSDASHELRSPLASIAAQLDVDEAHPETSDHAQTAQRVRAETRRLQALVEDLLLMARHEGKVEATRRELVDFDDTVLVFERFVRLDEARSREKGGSGLGLAIVAEIVRAHNGSIDVSNSPRGGARFVVRLPGA